MLQGELISSIKVNVKESAQHVEVNVSDLKGYEKHVILELKRETQSKLSDSNPDNSKGRLINSTLTKHVSDLFQF